MATQSGCGHINKQAIKRMSSYLLERDRGERKKKGERERKKSVAGTRALPLYSEDTCKASSKRAYNCHDNQENAVLPCNMASYCPAIDHSDCNITSSHIMFPGVVPKQYSLRCQMLGQAGTITPTQNET